MDVDHTGRLLEAFLSPVLNALNGRDDLPDTLRDMLIKRGDGLDAGDATEQIPLPSLAVCPLNDPQHLVSRHPLAAACVVHVSVPRQPAKLDVESFFEIQDAHARYLAVWRLLPDRFAKADPAWLRYPAQPLLPDHTIWHAADTAAAFAGASRGGSAPALLQFHMGPVQAYIEAARSLRDLWTGSAILSWLTFKAMEPILESVGPAAFTSPSLRGNPMVDRWLRSSKGGCLGNLIEEPDEKALMQPSLPNVFTALVPAEEGEALAAGVEQSVRAAWKGLADKVKTALQEKFGEIYPDWNRNWDAQIESYFEVRTAVVPYATAADEARLAKLLGSAKDAGRWQLSGALAARVLAARRGIRAIPLYSPAPDEAGRYAQKCSLLGTVEQMGPADLQESKNFWENAASEHIAGSRVRKNERFGAVALVKRFAPKCGLNKSLGLSDPELLRWPDTATLAATCWLEEAGIDPDDWRKDGWSGQWLHWPTHEPKDNDGEKPIPKALWDLLNEKKKKEAHGKPPAYYAIVQMDGDDMGKWISGQKNSTRRDALSKEALAYFEGISGQPEVKKALDAPRPLSPTLHAALSTALGNFSMKVVPRLVQNHDGELIYAGGDDVLALLPLRKALAFARDVRNAWGGVPGENEGADQGYYRLTGKNDTPVSDLLMPGPVATLSAGIAVVHYKADLREALDAARKAERRAKDAGRDCLDLTIVRRSGEHSHVTVPWNRVSDVDGWVREFVGGASDRWAYHLRQEAETLGGLAMDDAKEWEEMIALEIKRRVSRSERREAKSSETVGAQTSWDAAWRCYLDARIKQDEKVQRKQGDTKPLSETEIRQKIYCDFLTLVQSASFLARGRDDR